MKRKPIQNKQSKHVKSGQQWKLASLGLMLVIGAAIGAGAFLVADSRTTPEREAVQEPEPKMVLVPNGTSMMVIDEEIQDSHAAEAFLIADSQAIAEPEMVQIPSGSFMMGIDKDVQDSHHARPRHEITLSGFWIGKTEVTNEQYQAFVEDTGYKTIAEQKPKREDFPNAPEEKLVPFSAVFTPPDQVQGLNNHLQWWKAVPGASWRHPEGPESSIAERMNHPVVHVSWIDANEYCKWLSKKTGKKYRLPTEAEWEYAARGGKKDKEFVWGDDKPGADGKWQANIWQGEFPKENTKKDGYVTTAPVGSFPPNGYGLYDMSGNVWEWCWDWYHPNFYQYSPPKNPQGPARGVSRHPGEGPARVQRGGSFLCCDEYCRNYRTWTRHAQTPDSAANHIGFRVVREAD